MSANTPKILILGAGPAGLGAAARLAALGHADWELWEQEAVPGGLSRSLVDSHGFTWDLGGHVQFSHYKTFDEAMDRALGVGGWLHHQRESWIRTLGAWIPYPFQNNIHRLPPEARERCLAGLRAAAERPRTERFANFRELIEGTFGAGIAELFMIPYNTKVWGWPPETLDTGWIGERVALPNIAQITESIATQKDQVSWGPNQTFRFAKRGGTGAIWTAVAASLPQNQIHYNRTAAGIDPAARRVREASGAESSYDALISTIPLDRLLQLGPFDSELIDASGALRRSGVHVIGIALNGQPAPELKSKYWMYFPDRAVPFFRVTVFSNYSPANVPDPARTWSLMAEVTEIPGRPLDRYQVIRDTINGLLREGLIASSAQVHHTFHTLAPYAYPTPALGRDEALVKILPTLERMGIYSRGRFGAWKYEVSNQDHSMMQGHEAVNRILYGCPELTLWYPEVVNNPHPAYGKNWL